VPSFPRPPVREPSGRKQNWIPACAGMTNPMAHDPHHHGSDHAHHGVGHIVSPKILIATAVALLCLTGITVWSVRIDFAEFDLKEMNIFVAMGIALVKATLVCLFFMHLRWDRPFNGFILVGSLAFVALFIAFTLTDTAEYQPEIQKVVTPLIQAELDKLPK